MYLRLLTWAIARRPLACEEPHKLGVCVCVGMTCAFVCVLTWLVWGPRYDTQQLGGSFTVKRGCGAEVTEISAAAFLACMFPKQARGNLAFCFYWPKIPVKMTTPQKLEKPKHRANENLAERLRRECSAPINNKIATSPPLQNAKYPP